MSAAAALKPVTETFEAAPEKLAPALARAHLPLRRASRRGWTVSGLGLSRSIERAAERFRISKPEDPAHQKAAEWFLDNYFLVTRAVRQIKTELPKGFRRRLPHTGDDSEPRALRIAYWLVETTALELDEAALFGFTEAYQEIAPLGIAELWALPTMLRIAVLEALVELSERLFLTPRADKRFRELAIEPAVGVGRAIRALRLLAEIDWKTFFQKTSVVDALLLTDPAGVYAKMDFETRDAYRKVVEELAWTAECPEPEVAKLAVKLAGDCPADRREGHVGYYLLDRGRARLEAQIGYRPRGKGRARRALLAHPTLVYLGTISALTLAMLAGIGFAVLGRLGPGLSMLVCALALVPASSIAVALVNAWLTAFLSPRTLPKLDFSEGIPEDCKTAIVIPALVATPADVDELLAGLELHFLSNPDPLIEFVLLTDHVDSSEMPDDAALLAHARVKVDELNEKHGKDRSPPFHLLHRESRWNQAEARFMAWERKRGKLEEFNRLLRGDQTTSFKLELGAPAPLRAVRFVITLDADTELPFGAAQRLIGLIAHPLNRASFGANGRVVAGYTVVQPRVEASPTVTTESWFSRTFAGDTALDIYTCAVSDVYQDLFGAGVYVGKGIYDVDAFTRSLEGRVPENSLVSHDLFEGIQGRAALATDIVLFEEYPHHYLAFARRMQRWIRGDWQLLPWLLPRLVRQKGADSPALRIVDRWKIADNLRRSLFGPSLLVLLLFGLFAVPRLALPWTLGVLLVPLLMVAPALLGDGRKEAVARWLFLIATLPHEAAVALDAIARVLVRLTITRKHLLEWTTAAHTARAVSGRSQLWPFYREMRGPVLLGAALLIGLSIFEPWGLAVAGPLCVVWLLSPVIAQRASAVRVVRKDLEDAQRRALRRLARRTWLFSETFVVPGDQWLPPDNYQLEPDGRVAHRTSPTNIGLLFLAQLSALDFGYIGASELRALVHHTLDSLERLERYRGHILNWYDTKTRNPLLPRYVSTVDSGNLAAALITLEIGSRDAVERPVLGTERWQGLLDTLELLEEALRKLPDALAATTAVKRIHELTARGARESGRERELLTELFDSKLPQLEQALLDVLDRSREPQDLTTLREARTWLERLNHQLYGMRGDLEVFFPWLALVDEAKTLGIDLGVDAASVRTLSLIGAREACARARAALSARRQSGSAGSAWLERALELLLLAETRAEELESELASLAARANAAWTAMDFGFLYDPKRQLFHIGYNKTSDRLDPHYYDLLASEARLASYIAVMKQQVPAKHWHTLGRPVTRIHGQVALLSWGGTMFEYLMPALFMRSPPNTLLTQSMELAVRAQIDYGAKSGTPWGISESGFGVLDGQNDYQYRSFGVPGLGIKRGLEEDLVIAPYASLLAVSLAPREVSENLEQLEAMGAVGTHGLFEALDFSSAQSDETATNASQTGPTFTLVRSHMAHHQAMILAALDNALNDRVLVERFHAHPLVKTAELLLSERLPLSSVSDVVDTPQKESIKTAVSAPAVFPAWSPERAGVPEVALLSNGNLTTLISDAGAGWTRFKGLDVVRGSVDPTCDSHGIWIYVRDRASGRTWSVTPAPTRPRAPSDQVVFHPHKAEFHHREQGISLRTEIAIGPRDDVELRYVTLHNETDEPRTLVLTSYAEPVLDSPAAAAQHPAFSRLFVECEAVPELHGVLAARRPRNPEDANAAALHYAVWDDSDVKFVGSQIDRAQFLGRGRDARAPRSVTTPTLENDSRPAKSLDPLMSLEVEVRLEPYKTVTLAFVTAVAPTRAKVLELARRFGSSHAVNWAIQDAERRSARRLEKAGVSPELLPQAMRLASRLLVPLPQVRQAGARAYDATWSKQRLWGHGISGDDPLLVIRVRDPDAGSVAEEVLGVYRFLRACKVRIELVFLDESASGYQADEIGRVRSFLARAGASAFLHQRGGIFVLAADQLAPEDRLRIEACARVLIDADRGSLDAHWLSLPAPPPALPLFSATVAPDGETPRVQPQPKLLFFNGFGGFTEDGREYVILLQDGRSTPAPWCNVLANPGFGCLVSESSLGTTWSENSGENRLTPWRNDPVSDTPSEALYLRDEETAEVWSPTPLPTGGGADVLVRHGAGYTVYERDSHGLSQELTVFVPPDAAVKIVRLKLTNRLSRHRRLTATYYAEWVLGTVREQQSPHVHSELDPRAQAILARSAYNADFAERVAYLAADRAPHGHTCDRTEFLGRSGSLAAPEALSRWGLSGSTRSGTDPCAALQTHLDLAPGQSLETHFVLGQGRDENDARALVERFRQPREVEASWQRLATHWDSLLGAVQVKTPEPAMDLMLNRWLLYQSVSSRFFARSAFYQSSGAFGFRDQLQDVMALVHVRPDLVREHLLLAASYQFTQGDVLHWWHPPAGRGVRTRCSDDMLWLPFVTCHYVVRTGDLSLLSEEVAFLEGAELGPDEPDRYQQFPAGERASLFEHCRRALERGFTQGPQGLPLMGGGDWNDGMNRVGSEGRGESVWLGWFVCATARAFAALAEQFGQPDEARSLRLRADALEENIQRAAWDGAWYVRAFYDDGTPLGSVRSKSCRIDSIAQSWSVLSGAERSSRQDQALQSAEELLVREGKRLVLLLDPPFEGTRHDPGYIKAYPPGVRENGGQYTHAAAWLGWAHARAGDGARAERIFRLLNPVLRNRAEADVERYRVEPYVLAADIYSGSALDGRGGWTWYTGAAAWTWRLGVEAILGLYREAGGYRFDPCIPPEWRRFEATVQLGPSELHVEVTNPEGVARGVIEVSLDGKAQDPSRVVELSPKRSVRHHVRIVLGDDGSQARSRSRERTVKVIGDRHTDPGETG